MTSTKTRNGLWSGSCFTPRMLRRARARRRGVSPIIATILLVAITVVLAAVLYVLISGLTHSSASTPYSINIGTPTWTGGTPNYGTMRIASATTGLTTSLFALSVATSTGVPVPVGTAATANCKPANVYSSTNCGAPTGSWYAVIYFLGNGTIANVYVNTAWSFATVGVGQSEALVVVGPSTFQNSGDVMSATGTGSSSVSGASGPF